MPRLFACIAVLAAACSATTEQNDSAAPGPATQAVEPAPATNQGIGDSGETAGERLERIGQRVSVWQAASDLSAARREAEAVRNLIVGPNGPGYGDSDGDGSISGASSIGLLPGSKGDEALALPAANACVTRDLLGGSWDQPEQRWSILKSKIDQWRPGNNTFPSLPSHAQRIVGWATLTLAADDPATARDYAGHAQIHVEVARRALDDCR